MSTERALLAALHADPGDHTARLALADWLEEQGRAEQSEVLRLHVRQMTRSGTRDELGRLCALLASGVRPVVPELVSSTGLRLALVPAGTFWMGSPETEEGRAGDEGPQHEVELTEPFYLGVVPVTQGEYEAVMGSNPSHFWRGGKGARELGAITDTSRFPVENVSWGEAVEFCKRLTERDRKAVKISPDQEYRLPTEAQWEYACRGGAASYQVFHTGDTLSSRDANFDGTSPYGDAEPGAWLKRPCEVGHYAPNAFGLRDMHGNVWEWCSDWYANDYYRHSSRANPRGPGQGSGRVGRGGGWLNHGQYCRSAYRRRVEPADRRYHLGFRVSLVPSGGAE